MPFNSPCLLSIPPRSSSLTVSTPQIFVCNIPPPSSRSGHLYTNRRMEFRGTMVAAKKWTFITVYILSPIFFLFLFVGLYILFSLFHASRRRRRASECGTQVWIRRSCTRGLAVSTGRAKGLNPRRSGRSQVLLLLLLFQPINEMTNKEKNSDD